MLSAGFEPSFPTGERPQTDALDLATTGINDSLLSYFYFVGYLSSWSGFKQLVIVLVTSLYDQLFVQSAIVRLNLICLFILFLVFPLKLLVRQEDLKLKITSASFKQD